MPAHTLVGPAHPVATVVRWRRCGPRGCGHVWRHRGYRFRPHVFLVPPPVVVIAPAIGGRWRAHVRWCYAHHRFYNARTNLFIGRDGLRHVCLSPYR
jgi:hypothetical protein